MGERAFGHLGLQMMMAGAPPARVVDALVAGDASLGIGQIA